MEKAKAESDLSFWNTEGAVWRKIPFVKFSFGESEDIVESVSRTRDKNIFNQIKRFRSNAPRPVFKASTISGSLYFKPFSSVASLYCSLVSVVVLCQALI